MWEEKQGKHRNKERRHEENQKHRETQIKPDIDHDRCHESKSFADVITNLKLAYCKGISCLFSWRLPYAS